MNDLKVIPTWQSQHRELDDALALAHAQDDREALVILYTKAADAAEIHHDTMAARFYLTHAYVFALDVGSTDHVSLQIRLDAYHAQDTDSIILR